MYRACTGVFFALIFPVPADAQGTLAVVGDTQVTTWVERLMGREYNADVTPKIFEFIAGEKPSALLHLGDSVTCGGCPEWMPEWFLPSWGFLARAIAPVETLRIPRYLAIGNHEHWGREAWMNDGIRKFFPETLRNPMTFRFGQVEFLIVDSSHAADQREWFQSKLGEAANDPAVKMVVVASHHPPFSNSKVVGGHRPSREAFLDLFEGSAKAKLWLSGHAHGYEHFVRGSKHFVVSAGGGGARQPQAETKEHEDRFRGPFPRPYNYLLLRENSKGLRILVRGWNRGEVAPKTIDEMDLDF